MSILFYFRCAMMVTSKTCDHISAKRNGKGFVQMHLPRPRQQYRYLMQGLTLLKRYSICVVLLLVSHLVQAEKVFDFSATCQQAYHQITSLKLNAGAQLLNQARRENPDNLIPEMLEGYIDFYILFFNEEAAEYKTRMPHFEQRLEKMEQGPVNTPFYNFCRTILFMQRACVEIKFGRQWSAGWDFRKAFTLIKQNRKDYPNFLPNNLIYGPMVVAADIIPDGYKWMASLFGFRGSLKDGIALMQQLLNSNDPLARMYFNEASFYYCYIMFYIQNKPDEVFRYIAQKQLDIVNNHLMTYMAANLAMNDKRSEYTQQVIANRNHSPEYLSTAVWDFELAYAKMHHLELQEAAKYFESYLAKFKGNFYVKDACEKLSWCYYLMGNNTAAENARQMTIKRGSQVTDSDKQAYKSAKSGVWPNTLLLKVRLLNDGGYNTEALNMLAGKSNLDFIKPEEQLEFLYRAGRIYDDLKRNEDALRMYQLAIKMGEKRTEYYAAKAALQMGYIYERTGRKDLAIASFQQCLDMKNHDYKDSLDQKAKAGIARCQGK